MSEKLQSPFGIVVESHQVNRINRHVPRLRRRLSEIGVHVCVARSNASTLLLMVAPRRPVAEAEVLEIAEASLAAEDIGGVRICSPDVLEYV